MAFSVHLLPRDLKWDWREEQRKADWGQNSKFLGFSQISSQSQPSNCDLDLVQLAINILKCVVEREVAEECVHSEKEERFGKFLNDALFW